MLTTLSILILITSLYKEASSMDLFIGENSMMDLNTGEMCTAQVLQRDQMIDELHIEEEEDVQPFTANQKLHRLINTLPINRFILRSPQVNRTKKYGIILLVISAEWEIEERIEIRKQWESAIESSMQRNGDSLVVFLVSRSSRLDEEAALHGDLLQIDLDETYRNLVYKIEVGFRWLSENVQSDFVAKIDSDTVVHIDRLYALLRGFETVNELRFVSHLDYPSNVYPRYCSGAGYVMKRPTFDVIAKSMGKSRVFEVEDAFFTGIVAQHLGSIVYILEVGTAQYTEHSTCGAQGPNLSILNTHYQFGEPYNRKNLTAAWERLKTPYCY